MPKPCLFALAALIATAPSHATNGAAQQIIERLDLTSFSNSVGPRRIPGKTSFADYGFTTVEEGVDGATLKPFYESFGRHSVYMHVTLK